MVAPRIAIIGGSMAGLFAAASLRAQGYSARVYERANEVLASRGAGITTHSELFTALRLGYLVAGPDDEVVPGKRFCNWGWYRTANENLYREHLTDDHGNFFAQGIPHHLVRKKFTDSMRDRICCSTDPMASCTLLCSQSTRSRKDVAHFRAHDQSRSHRRAARVGEVRHRA